MEKILCALLFLIGACAAQSDEVCDAEFPAFAKVIFTTLAVLLGLPLVAIFGGGCLFLHVLVPHLLIAEFILALALIVIRPI